jgi:hypothetical protein
MSKTFKIVNGDISDGYHTFDELYEHRCHLFLALALSQKEKALWRPDYDGWFCLYLNSECGQISYHIPDKMLHFVENKVKRIPAGESAWDGHTSADVINRLKELARLA